ncbi:MAG: SIMPL domain-containing protein [Prevotellaceae bacterium]|nr:SIMPL domain-containing protein [Prevotellaceae bacterium]
MTGRNLRVTGTGNLNLTPDLMIVSVEVCGLAKEYADALQLSVDTTEKIKAAVKKAGGDPSKVKTESFDVSPEHEHFEEFLDNIKTHKQRIVGYGFNHRLKYEFDSDKEMLSRILYEISKSKTNPYIRISYAVKDKEKAKNDLLGKAIEDSKTKAGIIAKTAGVRLKEIESIDYSWGHINFEYTPIDSLHCDEYYDDEAGMPLDINPDDISLKDSVTVVWSIE